MGRKRKNGEGTAQLRKDGLPKTKNVLAKTKGECVDSEYQFLLFAYCLSFEVDVTTIWHDKI